MLKGIKDFRRSNGRKSCFNCRHLISDNYIKHAWCSRPGGYGEAFFQDKKGMAACVCSRWADKKHRSYKA